MIRAALRVPVALLTLAVFLATGIGLPVHHHADHDGETTHLTSGEHGHGTTLIVRDMRTERPGASVDVPGVFAVRAVSEPLFVELRWTPRAPSTPRGRSPPSFTQARAPPSFS